MVRYLKMSKFANHLLLRANGNADAHSEHQVERIPQWRKLAAKDCRSQEIILNGVSKVIAGLSSSVALSKQTAW